MNKKIGILTFQDTTNFGSALQTYALWKTVNDLKYECEIINYICPKIRKKELPQLRYCKSIKSLAVYLLFGKYYLKKHKNIFKFFNEYAKVSEKTYDKSNIDETNAIYYQFLIGSDLVWNPNATEDYSYFLDFVTDNKKKKAYAPSIGDSFDEKQKSKIRLLLSGFERITVREKQAKEWIKELYDGKVDVVCDPTMLLTAKEWEKFINKRIIKKKYVLVYFNDEENKCINDAINYAKKNNFEVYFINYGKKKKGVKSIHPTKINEFLNLIFYAEHVFVASYHGLLFSIYFNKPFLFYNWARKSRMISLSEILEIKEQDGKKIDINNYSPQIDWNKINKNLDNFRSKSLEILKQMLNDGDKNV